MKRQSVKAFLERMKNLRGTALQTFDERALGIDVQIFGNVATVSAGCEIVENGGAISRGVEMLLLVKDEGQWNIVAQAWDNESPANPIPQGLAAARNAK